MDARYQFVLLCDRQAAHAGRSYFHLRAQSDDPVNWELSYFRAEAYVDEGGLDYFGGEQYDATPNASFGHKMSDIVMGGINAGMEIEFFEELPKHISHAWWNVENAGIGVPMSFVLVLRHPREK